MCDMDVVEKPGHAVEKMDFGFGGQTDAPGAALTSCVTVGMSLLPSQPHWLFCDTEKGGLPALASPE